MEPNSLLTTNSTHFQLVVQHDQLAAGTKPTDTQRAIGLEKCSQCIQKTNKNNNIYAIPNFQRGLFLFSILLAVLIFQIVHRESFSKLPALLEFHFLLFPRHGFSLDIFRPYPHSRLLLLPHWFQKKLLP